MKVAIFSESSADEAAIRILTEGILARSTEAVSLPPLRSRGWPSVRQVLPAVIKHLHYRTDADALVLVIDSNHQSVHLPAHEENENGADDCRLCRLRQVARRIQSELSARPNKDRLKIATGMAVPCIEAWLLCGIDPHVTEAAWQNGLIAKRDPFSKNSLKQAVYGTDRPSLELEVKYMKAQAERLKTNLSSLETLFPNGFGSLLRDMTTW